jgi:hypothetical protein
LVLRVIEDGSHVRSTVPGAARENCYDRSLGYKSLERR